MGQLTNAPKCATNANAFDIANSFEKEDIPLKLNDSLADRKRNEHLRLYVIALCIASVILSLVLCILAFIFASLRHSPATFAFAADCVLDLLSSFIVIWRYFGSPYRLGSYSREYKACISLGVLFMVAGIGVIIEGIYFLFEKDIPKWYTVLIILAAVGSIVCFIVGFAKYVLGKKLNSQALYLDAKKDCMIDSEKGWYDMDNVYTCEDNQRCCKEYGNPSCCAEKNKWLIVKDQLILWGGLFGFLSFLGLVVYCRRHDFYVLEGSNPCARCLGIKPKELVEEGDDEEKPIKT